MVKKSDYGGLGAWLKGKPPTFALVLAARAPRRVAPEFHQALQENVSEVRIIK